MIARHRTICPACNDDIKPGQTIGQHPMPELGIVWLHNRCIPHEDTIGPMGTPSGRSSQWRRKPRHRYGPAR